MATSSPAKGSPWSDKEKLALLIGAIQSLGGTPKWSAMPIPQGRTLGTCRYMYGELLKKGADVPMTTNATLTAQTFTPSKRGRVGKKASSATPTKRTLEPNSADEDGGADAEDGGGGGNGANGGKIKVEGAGDGAGNGAGNGAGKKRKRSEDVGEDQEA